MQDNKPNTSGAKLTEQERVLLEFLRRLLINQKEYPPPTVQFGETPYGTFGKFRPYENQVVIDTTKPRSNTNTLAHELIHYLRTRAGNENDVSRNQRQQEFITEDIARRLIGLQSGQYPQQNTPEYNSLRTLFDLLKQQPIPNTIGKKPVWGVYK